MLMHFVVVGVRRGDGGLGGVMAGCEDICVGVWPAVGAWVRRFRRKEKSVSDDAGLSRRSSSVCEAGPHGRDVRKMRKRALVVAEARKASKPLFVRYLWRGDGPLQQQPLALNLKKKEKE
jgi:hypothetical protein